MQTDLCKFEEAAAFSSVRQQYIFTTNIMNEFYLASFVIYTLRCILRKLEQHPVGMTDS